MFSKEELTQMLPKQFVVMFLRISKGGNSSYILGSKHTDNYAAVIKEEVQKIIDQCAILYCEMEHVLDLSFLQYECVKRDSGVQGWYENLSQDIISRTDEIINTAISFLKAKNPDKYSCLDSTMRLENFSPYKKEVIFLLITGLFMSMSLVKSNKQKMFDVQIEDNFRHLSKPIYSLDTIEMRLAMFSNMELNDTTIKDCLSLFEKISFVLPEEEHASTLTISSVTDPFSEDSAYENFHGNDETKVEFHQFLVDKCYHRNIAWFPTLQSAFAKNKNNLVVVGSLHLFGENGILSLFHAYGYKIELFHDCQIWQEVMPLQRPTGLLCFDYGRPVKDMGGICVQVKPVVKSQDSKVTCMPGPTCY